MRYPAGAVPALLMLVALLGCTPQGTTGQASGTPRSGHQAQPAAQPDFAGLEQRFQARLGVYAIDTGSGAEITHRAGERWAFCSTIKTFTAAAALRRTAVDELDRRITYTHADLVPYSPVTEKHVATGMTLRALLRAAVRDSDNTAHNLLLRELGGPAGLQRELRALGDTASHVDRYEPELNETAPGDIRDTSTPRALATNLRAVVLGDVLPRNERDLLRDAMRNSPLTTDLVQAGMPRHWRIEDKSGAGDYGTRNDIAVLYPPERAPIVLVVLTDRDQRDADHDDALIAEAARVTLAALS